MLSGAVKRLRTTNQLKEGMEKVIIDQCKIILFYLDSFISSSWPLSQFVILETKVQIRQKSSVSALLYTSM